MVARRATVLGLLSLALGSGAGGAEGQVLRPFDAAAGFIGIGASGITTGELDDYLAGRGYPTFGQSAAGVMLGGHGVMPNGIMLGAEWHGVILEEKEHEGRDVGIGGGYGTLGAGYAVEVSSRARFYPWLGVGGGGLGIWIESEGEVGFDDVLDHPDSYADIDRGTVLSRASMVIDIGGGAEFLPGGRRGPLIGVRFGYVAAPFSSEWQLDEGNSASPASGGPAASLAGPYLRVTFGAGWRR